MKKRLLAILFLLFICFPLMACGNDPTPAPSTGHVHTYESKYSYDATSHWQKASCEHTSETTNKAAHTFGDWTVVTEATATAAGQKQQTCTVCGYKVTKEIPKTDHVHSWDEGKVTTAATCQAKGIKTYTCTVCGETMSEETAKVNHEFKEGVVVAPTCTEKGYTKHECKNCDYSYNDTETDAVGHTGGTATCSAKAICAVCNQSYGEANAINHTWNEGVVTKAATCTTDGEKTYTCSGCNAKKTVVLPQTGHDYKDGIVVAPTCTEKGYTKHECKNCAHYYTDTLTDALGHTGGTATCSSKAVCDRCNKAYGELKATHDYKAGVVTPATCTTNGYTLHECQYCDNSYKDEIVTALGHIGGTATCVDKAVCTRCNEAYGDLSSTHTYKAGVVTAPTCTEDGYTLHECQYCDHSYKDETVAQLGHIGGTATCTQKAICSRCNHPYGDVNPDNHSFDFGEVIDPTCTEDGYTKFSCKNPNCSYSYTSNVVSALGHTGGTASCGQKAICDRCEEEYGTLDDAVHVEKTPVVVAATCTEEGYTLHECKDCHWTWKTDSVEKIPHQGGTATCTKKAVCVVCGNSYGELDTENHAWDDGTVTTAATCLAEGVKTYKCTRCEAVNPVTEPVAKVAHNHVKTTTVAATCKEQGYDLYECSTVGCTSSYKTNYTEVTTVHTGGTATCSAKATCTVCGKQYGELGSHTMAAATCTAPSTCSVCGHTEGEKKEHTWNAGEITTASKCGVPGVLTKTCSTCAATQESAVAALEHNIVNVAATCVEKAYTYCDREGCTYKTTPTGELAAHTWNQERTCTQGHFCTNAKCSASEPAYGHNYEQYGDAHAATCTEQGYTEYKCSRCEDVIQKDFVAALGHNPTGTPTAVQVGQTCEYVHNYACTRCTATNVEGEHFYSHTYKVEITTQATCKTKGLKTITCTNTNCPADAEQHSYTEEIPMNENHTWDDGVSVTGGTKYTCTTCGETKTVVESSTSSATVSSDALESAGGVKLSTAELKLDDTAKDALKNKDLEVSADTLSGDDLTNALSKLSSEQQAQLGNSKVYNFVISEGGNTISQFGDGGKITITLPYELGEDENPDNIAIWYMSDAAPVSYPATYYEDADGNGFVTFETDHFSYYAVTKLTPAERCALYNHQNEVTTILPTCTEDGYTLTVCKRCGEQVKDNVVDALGHNYIESKTAATCTANGQAKYTCSHAGCGDSYTNIIPALGHDYSGDPIHTDPTCTTAGSDIYSCQNAGCLEKKKTIIAMTGHDYKTTTVDATCTTAGYEMSECKVCNQKYMHNYQPALGHSYVESWVWNAESTGAELHLTCEHDASHELSYTASIHTVLTAATCTTAGNRQVVATVIYNGTAIQDTKDNAITALGHTFVTKFDENNHWNECVNCAAKENVTKHVYGETAITVVPTCTAKGEGIHACTCGYDETLTLDKVSHTLYEVIVKPTCEASGSSTMKCRNCDYAETPVALEQLTHNYVLLENKPATCTEQGYNNMVCTFCQDTQKETIEMLAHDCIDTVTKATCTAEGYTTHACKNCDYTLVDTVTAQAPHKWSNGAIEVIATCIVKGEKKYTCLICGATRQEDTGYGDHSYENEVVESTCSSKGYTVHTCKYCDDSYTDSVTDKLAHTWNDGVVTTAPACTTKGVMTYSCTKCDATKTEAIAATGHTVKNTVVAATCTTKGYTLHECEKCDYATMDTEVAALDHDWNDGEVTTAPTCTEKGITTYSCSRCSETYTEAIAATGHTYTTKVTNPTCTVDGYTTYTCACGDTYASDYVLATGHSFGEWTTVTEATYETEGLKKHTCSVCETEETEVLPSINHTHDWAEEYTSDALYHWVICKDEKCNVINKVAHSYEAATCDAPKTCSTCKHTEGEKLAHTGGTATCIAKATCELCGNTYGEYAAHDYKDATCTAPATCTVCHETKGEALGHIGGTATCTALAVCTRCGAEYGELLAHQYFDATCTEPKTCKVCSSTTGEALGHYMESKYDDIFHWVECTRCHEKDNQAQHEFGEVLASKPATCTATGEGTHTCSCGFSEEVIIPMTSHAYEGQIIDATCISKGYTLFTCPDCGKQYKDNYSASYGAHTYEDKVVAPTCTAAGYTSHTCSLCEHSYNTDMVDMLPHTYEETVVAPTCTAKGYTAHTCSVCKDTYQDKETDMIAHSYEANVVNPTCTAKGYTVHTCSVCKDTYQDTETDMIAHSYNEGEVTTAATCTTAGETTYTCTVCKATKTEEIHALGHDYKETKVAPTCEEEGYTENKCSRCEDKVISNTVDATGHKYSTSFAWNEDYTSCSLIVLCANNKEHNTTVDATIESKTISTVNCGTDGKVEYTATAVFNGETLTETKASITPKTGDHNYVNGVCTVCNKEEVSCTHEDLHIEKIDVSAHGACPNTVLTILTCDCGEYSEILDYSSTCDYKEEEASATRYVSVCKICGCKNTSDASQSKDGCYIIYAQFGSIEVKDFKYEFYVENRVWNHKSIKTQYTVDACSPISFTVEQCSECGEYLSEYFDPSQMKCEKPTTGETKTDTYYAQSIACEVCGVEFIHEQQMIAYDSCYGRTIQSSKLLKNGKELINITKSQMSYNHENETIYTLTYDTCEEGYNYIETCKVCGYTRAGSGMGHSYAPTEIFTLETTCGKFAFYKTVCSICGYTDMIEPKMDISCGKNIEQTMNSFKCNDCGLYLEFNTTETKLSDCKTETTRTFTCTYADQTDEIVMKMLKLSHDYEDSIELTNGKDCTEGWTRTRTCKTCNTVRNQTGVGHNCDGKLISLADIHSSMEIKAEACVLCGALVWFAYQDYSTEMQSKTITKDGITYYVTTGYLYDGTPFEVTQHINYEDAESCYGRVYTTYVFYDATDKENSMTFEGVTNGQLHMIVYEYQLVGTVCAEGWTKTVKCANCGKIYETSTGSGCILGDYEIHEDSTVNPCGATNGSKIYVSYCAICGKAFGTAERGSMKESCNYEVDSNSYEDENGAKHVLTTLSCEKCGYVITYDAIGIVDGCLVNYTCAVTHKMGEKTIYSTTIYSVEVNHKYQQSYTFVNGKDCSDGYTIDFTCDNCDFAGTIVSKEHQLTYTRTKLIEEGICGGYITETKCGICGYVDSMKFEPMCKIGEYVQTEEVIDGITHVYKTGTCIECGLVDKTEYVLYPAKELCRFETIMIQTITYKDKIIGSYTTNQGEHTWHDVEYIYKMQGATCTDGVIRISSCTRCGYGNEEVFKSHIINAQSVVVLKDGMCDELSYSHGVCEICKQEVNQNLNYKCSMMFDHSDTIEDEAGKHVISYYKCMKCGLYYTQETTTEQIDPCESFVSEIMTYYYKNSDDSSELLVTIINSFTNDSHSWQYKLLSDKANCNDSNGYEVYSYCEKCGMNHTSNFQGHFYVGSNTNLAEYGCCEGRVTMSSCIVCGQANYAYLESSNCNMMLSNSTYEKDGYTHEVSIQTCQTCGLVITRDEYQVPQEKCSSTVYYSVSYTFEGKIILSYNGTFFRESHSMETISCSFNNGENCNDGVEYYEKCKVCGNESKGFTYGHSSTIEKYSMNTGCGSISYELHSCTRCDWTMTNNVNWSCVFECVRETNENGCRIYEYKCKNCDATYTENIYSKVNSDSPCYSNLTIVTTYVYGDDTLTKTSSSTNENHEMELDLSTKTGSCEDGNKYVSCTGICSKCGAERLSTFFGHHTKNIEVDLGSYGCGGVLSLDQCIFCDKTTHSSFVNSTCSFTTISSETIEDDKPEHTSRVEKCSTCGLIRTVESYLNRVDGCIYYYNNEITYQSETEVFASFTSVENQIHHSMETTYTMKGDSCTDGISAYSVCTICRYELTELYGHHRMVYEEEPVTLDSGLCYVVKTCYCGKAEEIEYTKEDCDFHFESAECFMEDRIQTCQYVDGSGWWCGIEDQFGIYTCAVTEPETCGYVIRYACYYVLDSDACIARQVKVYQFGYDALTGTSEYEYRLYTGQTQSSHNMEYKDEMHLHAVCSKCGSTYDVVNEYSEDQLTRTTTRTSVYLSTYDEKEKQVVVEEYQFELVNDMENTVNHTITTTTNYKNGDITVRTETFDYTFTQDGRNGYKIIRTEERNGERQSSTESHYVNVATLTGSRTLCIYEYHEYGKYGAASNLTTYRIIDTCTREATYSNGTTEIISEHWYENKETNQSCSQPSISGEVCMYCGNASDTSTVIAPADHDFVEAENGGYKCSKCGIESATGVSGALILEDLSTEKSSVIDIGYWKNSEADYAVVVTTKVDDEVVTLDNVTVTDVSTTIVRVQKNEIREALAQLGIKEGTCEIRITFVPVEATSFDYSVGKTITL